MTTKRKRPAGPNVLRTAPKIRPLDPGKPLAPYRVPELKAFDRHIPGQGAFSLDPDDPFATVYPDGEPAS